MGDTTRTSCSIAMAKITVPPCSHLAIERVDALDALVECLARKLVAIEAPKGSAKTSFLAEAYRHFDEGEHWEVAWLSVDGADGKQRLLCHMLAALRTVWSDLDLDGLAGLYEENENRAVVELSNFIYGHAQDKSISYVLFVDDLHRAEPEAIEFMMALAMRYFPSNVHVVASGNHLLREYVDLAFYDEMSLFPQEKLFFSEDDIVKSLVKARDFLFSPQTPFDSLASARLEESDLKLLAGDLWDKTGGWPFGVWSYVNMLARGTIDFSVSVDKRALQSGLNRFFRNSVFDELSEDVRQFLLCVALPDRINAELCNALTGRTDAKFILRDLRVRGMFIETLPNQSEWFAFYPLFHRWLRRKQEQKGLAWIRDLCQKASDWFESHGALPEAAKYQLMASDSNFVESLASVFGFVSDRGDMSFCEWVGLISAQDFTTRPQLALQVAWSYVMSARSQEGRHWIDVFEEAACDASEESRSDISVVADLARVKCLELECDYDEAIAQGEDILLTRSDGVSLSQRALLVHLLAESYVRRGRFDDALRGYLQAEAMAEIDGAVPYVALCRKGIILLRTVQGRFNDALELCDKALRECPEDAFPYASLLASKVHLLVAMDRCEEARGCVEKARELTFSTRNMDMLYEAEAERAFWLACTGQGDQAFRVITKVGLQIGEHNVPRSVDLLVYLKRVDVALSMGYVSEAQAAVRLLEKKIAPENTMFVLSCEVARFAVEDASGDPGQPHEVLPFVEMAHDLGLGMAELQLCIRAAERFAAQGDRRLALSYVSRALSVQAGQGIVGPFLWAGPSVRALLHEIVDVRKSSGRVRLYAKSVLRHFDLTDTTESNVSEGASSPMMRFGLTERECEVFELLDSGLSRREIAETLGVATNTVKSHVSRIYGKLGVTNRIDAFSVVHSGEE